MNRRIAVPPACADLGDLPRLLDPSALLFLLLQGGIRLTRVDVDYLRLKPGEVALVGIRAEGSDRDGGPTACRGYVRTYHDARRAEAAAAKWERMRPHPSPLGPGVTLLPGGRSVLFLFPNDLRLRGLRFIADMEKLKRTLADVRDLAAGGWRVRGRKSAMEPVRYKPERRFIARLDLGLRNDATGAKGRRLAFLRFFADDRGRRIEAIADSLAALGGDPIVPTPLGCALAGRIFVEEGIEGPEILGSIRDDSTLAHEVAERLRRLHGASGLRGPARSASHVLESALLALGALREAGLLDDSRHRRLEASLRANLPRPVAPTPVHGDLHLHQIVLGPAGPVFVDFERFGLGDPLQDVGNLVAHLRAYAVRDPEAAPALEGFRERFASAYFASGPERPQRDLAFYTACGLAELALLPFRRLEPAYETKVIEALDLLERTIGEAPHGPPAATGGAASAQRAFGVTFDSIEIRGATWQAIHPKRNGPWPGFFEDSKGRRVWGQWDPERLRFEELRPEDDPLFARCADWLRRGTLVAYRPGNRAVIRVADAPGARYAKITTPARASRSLRIHEALRAIPRVPAGFPHLPEVLEADADRGIVVYAGLEGTSLFDRLGSGARREPLERTASALAAFHTPAAPDCDVLRRRDATTLGEWAGYAASTSVGTEARFVEVLEAVEEASQREAIDVPGKVPHLVHGDLHDRNVFLHGDRVSLLDVDSMRAGDPALDAGNLAAEIVLRALRRGAPINEGREDASVWIRAYAAAGGGGPLRRIRVHGARSLFRIACVHLFRRPTQRFVPQLLEEARSWALETW